MHVKPSSIDIDQLARLILSEASTQTILGKYAVGQVLLNRSTNNGTSVIQEIYRKGQFDGIKTKWFKSPDIDSSYYVIAERILDQRIPDQFIIPKNIYYYYNPTIATDTAFIDWVEPKHWKLIDDHQFAYK